MIDDANPYEAPRCRVAPATSGQSDQLIRIRIAFVIVFLLNLPIALIFGWGLTQGWGRLGLFSALLVLLVLGYQACGVYRASGPTVIVGGILVALSQFIPILHIFAGVTSFRIAALLGLAHLTSHDLPENVPDWPGGFFVTLVVGGMLMGFAFVLGLGLRAITPRRLRSPSISRPGPGRRFP
jgi:hypothetical protein